MNMNNEILTSFLPHKDMVEGQWTINYFKMWNENLKQCTVVQLMSPQNTKILLTAFSLYYEHSPHKHSLLCRVKRLLSKGKIFTQFQMYTNSSLSLGFHRGVFWDVWSVREPNSRIKNPIKRFAHCHKFYLFDKEYFCFSWDIPTLSQNKQQTIYIQKAC